MTATAMAAPKPTPWWLLLVQGILAVIIGALFFIQPVATTKTAVFVLGAYWLILGILDIVGLFRDRTAWGWKLFTGIIAILAGGVILSGFLGDSTTIDRFLTTAMVGVTIAWVIGFLGVMYGIIMLIQAFRGGGWGAGAGALLQAATAVTSTRADARRLGKFLRMMRSIGGCDGRMDTAARPRAGPCLESYRVGPTQPTSRDSSPSGCTVRSRRRYGPGPAAGNTIPSR